MRALGFQELIQIHGKTDRRLLKLIYSATSQSRVSEVLHSVIQLISTEIDECESSPCANEATCKDKLNAFECECPIGFRGVLCGMFM